VPFPEGLHDKYEELVRPDVLQPKVASDARDKEAGPGLPDEPEPRRALPPESNLHLKQIELTSRNSYGLRSKSEEMYPQAYYAVDHSFWEGLSKEQQLEVVRLQAVAQEKVGYERGTQKYFMEDFDPRVVDKKTSGERLVEIETPRLLIAGAMMGAALTMLTGFVFHAFTGPQILVTAGLMILAAVLTVIFGRN